MMREVVTRSFILVLAKALSLVSIVFDFEVLFFIYKLNIEKKRVCV
jgi:hypothetical protein